MMRKNRGFTLIELLVVMMILGVLATIVVYVINPVKLINQSRDAKARTELNQVRAAMQLYYNDNKSYPADPSSLVSTYMKQLPTMTCCGGGGQDYVASVAVNDQTEDDTDSADKCSQTAGAVFYICPD
jgi:prepilin-type N-terminal cleavage/methylation domain-containing protein